ncbi:MAG: hypothetical protein RCG15_05325 [Candidatus Rickettsia vulgarisii]
MPLDSKYATYATAAATIFGAIVVAPILIIKDKTTSTIDSFWKNLTEHSSQTITSDNNSTNESLTENTNEDSWNVVTTGNLSNT